MSLKTLVFKSFTFEFTDNLELVYTRKETDIASILQDRNSLVKHAEEYVQENLLGEKGFYYCLEQCQKRLAEWGWWNMYITDLNHQLKSKYH